MSYDLEVTVPRGITLAAVNEALAVPYVRFLLDLGASEIDADLLRAALPRARDPEMRAALEGRTQDGPGLLARH